MLMKEKRKDQRAEIERDRATHLREQMSRRQCYYSDRMMAKEEPQNYLCIIHDKMDQAKTWIPKISGNMPKSLSANGFPLPVSLTGMLTHGRDPGVYAHYSLTGLWPGDSDFTITSLARCLRDLEDFTQDNSGDISLNEFDHPNPLFQAIMHPEAFKVGYLDPKNISIEKYKGQSVTMDNVAGHPVENVNVDRSIPYRPSRQPSETNTFSATSSMDFKPLPPHLTLQMDNSGKDNKNQIVMAFCSDLVNRGVFKTVTMSFLMVGHTHEDVDAFFSKVSHRLIGQEVSCLLSLMAEVWESEILHPVSRLIIEVVDYKKYLDSFHMSFDIIGQSSPVAFHFSMRNNVPIFQYKAEQSKGWIPKDGRCIWSKDKSTDTWIFPSGDPPPKVMTDATYPKASDVVPFLRRYVHFFSKTSPDPTSQAYLLRQPLMRHWSRNANILDGIIRPLVVQPLTTRFWPRTNHGTGFQSDYQVPEDAPQPQNAQLAVLEEEFAEELFERDEMFVGRRSERERERWNPLVDIKEGQWIVLRPEEKWEQDHGRGAFWLVKSLGGVDTDHAGEDGPCPMFPVQWWRPKNVSQNVIDKVRYARCHHENQSWERDPGYGIESVHWQTATSAIFGFSSRMQAINIIEKGLKPPTRALDIIKETLARIQEKERALQQRALVSTTRA